jgi:hypothetical protein
VIAVQDYKMSAIKEVVRRAAYPGIVLCLCIVSIHAGAAEVQFNPRVEVGASYDDNANLAGTNANKVKTFGEDVDARLEVRAIEPTGEWRLTPEVDGAAYPGHSELNSNGEFLYFYGNEHGPRYEASAYGYLSSQSLMKNYLPTAALGGGLGQPEPGATIGNLASNRQNLGYVDPAYSLQMTPRRRLELNASFVDARYNHEFTGGYTDYTNDSGSAAIVLQATQTGSLALRATAANFKPHVGFATNTYGFETEWDGHFSQTKQYYMRLGFERSNFSPVSSALPSGPSATTVSGGIGTHWTYQVTELFADLTRNVAPTAQGYAVTESQLRLRLSRRLTERFAAFVGVRGIIQEPFSGTVAGLPTQHYVFATGGFEWRVLRQFSLVGAYDFTGSRYLGPSAQSNMIHFSFIYEPNRIADGPAITVGY